MPNKNDEFIIEITAMSNDGSGIGHHNDMVVFVRGAFLGDVVICHVIKAKKNYLVAIIKEFITKSNDRIESDCPVSVPCGGCVYREINYSTELKNKEQSVYDAFKRIGHIDIKPQSIIAGNRLNYRNKASYPVSFDGVFGFFANKTHRIIKNHDCKIVPVEFKPILDTVSDYIINNKISIYNENQNSGLIRNLVIRKAFKTGQIMVVLVISSNSYPDFSNLILKLKEVLKEKFASFQLNINCDKTNVIFGKKFITLYGKDYISDELCGLKFNISARSFYQVNPVMTEKLYNKVKEYAKPFGKTVLDLYCGTGTIGLTLAENAKKVIGIEIVSEAITNAKENAKLNNISNVEFYCADASKAAEIINDNIDIVILDPPRKGADMDVLNTIALKYKPEKIVFVSCNPATLARDASILNDFSYSVAEYTPVDMFPATMHVETVVLMTRA